MRKHSLIICCMAAVAAILGTSPAYAADKKTKPAAAAEKKPAADSGAAAYDAILKKYVKDGKFAYAELKANKANMATFKKFMAGRPKPM